MPKVDRFPEFVTSLPEVDLPFPGARGWLIQGEETQIVFAEFSSLLEVPEHAHDAQWEFVVAGSAELRLGGEACEYHAGDNFYIPAGVRHGATVQPGYRAMIVFNEPGRYTLKG